MIQICAKLGWVTPNARHCLKSLVQEELLTLHSPLTNLEPFIRAEDNPSTSGVPEDIVIYSDASSARQESKWGMHSLQGVMPRLKNRLYYEERGERGVIIEMIVRLFNICAKLIGNFQIRSTFIPDSEISAMQN